MNGERALVISDFTADALVPLLSEPSDGVGREVTAAPFGQVMPSLLRLAEGSAAHRFNFAVVWTRPEAVIPAFARLVAGEQVADEALDRDVGAFAEALLKSALGADYVLVPTWVLPAHARGLGPLTFRPGVGLARALMRMNLRLAELCSASGSLLMLDAARWLATVGKRAVNPKLWFASKMMFSLDVFEEAAADMRSAVRAAQGRSAKALVLDLDGTLWGGIVGEVGTDGIRLGGHDSIGEAFAEFQGAIKALRASGIVLAIVSKNDEATALHAIDNHPEMVLRRADFAAWRINWTDKAANVADLARELNLGVDALVFIDDSPVERARVREGVPGVLVPEWPADPANFAGALRELRAFDRVALTSEDVARADAYGSEREREAERASFGSLDDWLESLGLTVRVERLDGANLVRSAQLLNKTNQMNLTTRRMSEGELSAWAAGDDRNFFAFRVSDRFGEYGLTGLAGFELVGTEAVVSDYLLSCRVMGRGVEEAMLAVLVEKACEAGAQKLTATLAPTARNGPCGDFFSRTSRFEAGTGPHVFTVSCQAAYRAPAHVALEYASNAKRDVAGTA